MKKPCLLIMISSVLLFTGCMQSDVKTEVKLQLSENEYLYSKYYGYFDISQGQTVETAPPQLISELRAVMEPVKEKAIGVLAKRIESAAEPVSVLAGLFNKVAVTWVTVEEPNTWIITINRKVDSGRVTKLLEARTDGGFWETYEVEEIFQYISNVNIMLRDTSLTAALNIEPDTTEFGRENPLFRILFPPVRHDGTFHKGSTIGDARLKDTALLSAIFSLLPVKVELPRNLKLLWSYKPSFYQEDFISLHAIKASIYNSRPLLPCEYIVEASVNKKVYPPYLNISMNDEGAQLWARITRENIGRNIAFVMNGVVYFSGGVLSEISGGTSEISGNFTEEEAADMAILLGSGAMPKFGVKVMSIK